MKALAPLIAAAALVACGNADSPRDTTSEAAEAGLFEALSARCGQAYEGRVLGDDPRDEDWRSETLVMHIRECSDDEIRIPLHVGENRSRTWVVTVSATLQIGGMKIRVSEMTALTIPAPSAPEIAMASRIEGNA